MKKGPRAGTKPAAAKKRAPRRKKRDASSQESSSTPTVPAPKRVKPEGMPPTNSNPPRVPHVADMECDFGEATAAESAAAMALLMLSGPQSPAAQGDYEAANVLLCISRSDSSAAQPDGAPAEPADPAFEGGRRIRRAPKRLEDYV